ncbi:MAG TPA: 5-methyltetrahydropteroyltriglutamate--homocysteine S-methyltransferase, partial [Gammaproteobacteria bacterium]|nr:5-methyltetrahydropteroyltriglutamate--homocysteine S-methyltransferase [Gammaproteobacteria bacterium]
MAKVRAPPFRADHVGSLLRPAALKDARRRYTEGALDAAGLAAVEDREIERVAKKQQDMGLLGITDGELRRSWWHLDFLWGLDGVAEHQADFAIGFVGATPRTAGVRVDGRIGFSGHAMLEHYRFLHARVDAVPKLTIPAPSALLGRPVLPPIDARVYPRREELFDDLGKAYRAAVRAFAAAGCRYLQLDEVFIAMLCDAKYRDKMVARGDDPDALLLRYAALINTAIADAPHDMTVTLHLCRGNFKSTYMGAGGYEAVEDVLFNEIEVDGYFMEYDDERSGGFEPLRFMPRGKKVVLGLVSSKVAKLEDPKQLIRRIEEASK